MGKNGLVTVLFVLCQVYCCSLSLQNDKLIGFCGCG